MSLQEQIQIAKQTINNYIYETPLEKSYLLSQKTNTHVYLKCEHFQKTGSFKIRGALNKILSLSEKQREKGVIAASSGNHGLGVAMAAKITGTKAKIYLPENVSSIKLDGIKALDATVDLSSSDCLQAEIMARKIAEEQGCSFISPYNDPCVIAGQGTIGLEMLKQAKDLDAVFISVGGGGLMSGIASYLKAIKPEIQIIGCWPEHAPAMYECIKAGKIIEVPEKPTLSDGTAGGIEKNAITLEYCKQLIDKHILVSEDEIAKSMKLLCLTERYMVEGAAAVAFAGFYKSCEAYAAKQVAVVLCGRNINFDKFYKACSSV